MSALHTQTDNIYNAAQKCEESMKKTIWITGTILVVGIVAILMYFSFFRGKSSTPEGTFVKGVEVECRQNV